MSDDRIYLMILKKQKIRGSNRNGESQSNQAENNRSYYHRLTKLQTLNKIMDMYMMSKLSSINSVCNFIDKDT